MNAVKGWRTAAPAVATIGLLLAGCTGATPTAGPSQPQTPAQTQPANATGTGTPAAAGSRAAGGGAAAADTGTGAGSTSPGATVTLRINTPQSGQTIALPAPVSYTVTGLPFGTPAGNHLRVQVGQPVSYTLDFVIAETSGTVHLPVDKNLPGNRTLTFSLTYGDNVAITGPQASVTLQDVTITGPR